MPLVLPARHIPAARESVRRASSGDRDRPRSRSGNTGGRSAHPDPSDKVLLNPKGDEPGEERHTDARFLWEQIKFCFIRLPVKDGQMIFPFPQRCFCPLRIRRYLGRNGHTFIDLRKQGDEIRDQYRGAKAHEDRALFSAISRSCSIMVVSWRRRFLA